MNFFFLILLVASSNKEVEVRFTEQAPKIDGFIEAIWQDADSAYDFIQHEPYEKETPTERTVVYILQDKENLYIAFRCWAQVNKPIACLTKDEDYISFKIDPFGSRTTGYYFQVFASVLPRDGWILDDGREYDESWEGIWYRAAKCYDDRWELELKIPFKSIRYKKGLNEWGIQFERYSAANRETDFWTEVSQKEGDLVSNWSSLININPQATGYYFELYPEGYIRYDQEWFYPENTDSAKFKPSASLNFKWDVTPQMTINATTFPDFAQIESDPYQLNLSRYPTYLEERRPFFLEGKDIFRLSDFGQDVGFFDALDIFYTRKIGKSMNGEAVPIIGGLKVTNKTEDWNIGMLGAYTDNYERYEENDTVVEPNRGFGAIRARHRILGTSDIGMLISGAMVNQDTFNLVGGVDLVYRKGFNQLILQGAASDRNKKRGWAAKTGFLGFLDNFITFALAEVIQDSFDVTDIGFVPWAGQKQLWVMSGPYKQYQRGFLKNFFIAPGFMLVQEPGDTNWSKIGVLEINGHLRNRWGWDFYSSIGPYYEADTNYLHRSLNISVWGPVLGQHMNFGCYYGYEYNYWRNFLAYQGNNWFTFNYSIIPQMSIGFSSNLWIEWDTTNTIIAMTPLLRPNINFRFNADMSLAIFNEFVMSTPESKLGDTELYSNRLGLLFSWNFKPKSWFYIALNDYQAKDQTGRLEPQYRIGAIKVKYLIYF